MTRRLRYFTILVTLLGSVFLLSGCGDDDNPTSADQNSFPTIEGITISPNAAVYADDIVTLTPVTTDPDNDVLRYTWSKDAGVFNPVEAVGDSIQWTAPSTLGTYQVVVVGDDGNGGTSQKHIDLKVYGGDQSGTVDVVGGVRLNPVGGTTEVGYIDTGDTITLVWDKASPVTTDSTEPDDTKYAPDGSRLNAATLTVVSAPQFGYSDGLPVSNAARYSIIAQIGDDGEWFGFTNGADSDSDGIPDSFSAVAPNRGKLYLSLNEQKSLLVDNTGYWRFSYTIEHP